MPSKVSEPVLDFDVEEFKIENAEGDMVKYSYVGNCRDCETRLFHCESKDNADEKLPEHVAIMFPRGKNLYCGACYPDYTLEFQEPEYVLFEKIGQCVICDKDLFAHRAGPTLYNLVGDYIASRSRDGLLFCKMHYDDFLRETHPAAWREIHGIQKNFDGMVVDKWERELRG